MRRPAITRRAAYEEYRHAMHRESLHQETLYRAAM
jgi:hypothetical protein